MPPEIWEVKLPDLIQLFIRENRKTEALEVLLKNAWAEPLARYLKELGDVNPQAYFEAFKKAILPQIRDASSRGHYQNVAGGLKSMKKLKGQEKEFQEFLEEIRQINARRPAFPDELRGI